MQCESFYRLIRDWIQFWVLKLNLKGLSPNTLTLSSFECPSNIECFTILFEQVVKLQMSRCIDYISIEIEVIYCCRNLHINLSFGVPIWWNHLLVCDLFYPFLIFVIHLTTRQIFNMETKHCVLWIKWLVKIEFQISNDNRHW